jgi:hypothetical protein
MTKYKDIIIAVVVLILAYFIMKILWAVAIFSTQVIFVLLIAYILYLFLKKLL